MENPNEENKKKGNILNDIQLIVGIAALAYALYVLFF